MMTRSDATGSTTVLAPGKLPGALLARLLADHPSTLDPTVVVAPAPGHDAAVFHSGGELIVKSDPITFATASPAASLVAVNANDIACLGGKPRWMTVTALFPEGTTEADVERLFGELMSAAARDAITVVGGHSEITPGIDRLLLSATMFGPPGPNGVLHPGRAQPGDHLYLTRSAGIEGASILATELAHSLSDTLSSEDLKAARRLIADPGISIVADAQRARDVDGVHALHDPTEGGVATAIHELADASGLGADVDLDSVPMLEVTRRMCDALELSPFGLLASGALLIAADPQAGPALAHAFSEAAVPLTYIGTLTEAGSGRIALVNGARIPLPRYDADEISRAFARSA